MNENALPLRDLHLPDAIGWWPLAPGWWLVLAIVSAALGYLAWRLYKRWLFNAPRRYALRELARFEAEYLEHRNPVTLGKQLSELLRRGMLAYAPREEVAGLTGEAWLAWLDRGHAATLFSHRRREEPAESAVPRSASDFSDIDIDALISAVRMRLGVPLRGAA